MDGKEILAIVIILFLASVLYVNNGSQTTTTTTTTIAGLDCKSYYWFDNTHNECGTTRFCGAFMYLGLRVFTTLEECQQALQTTTTTTIATTTTVTTTTTVAPSGFAILSAEANPNPVKTNRELNLSAKVSDPKSDFVQVVFCKEPTCSFTYCSKTDYASPAGKVVSCTFVPTVVVIGNNSFWVLGKKAGAQTALYGPVKFTVVAS